MDYSKKIQENLDKIIKEVKENGFIPINMGYYKEHSPNINVYEPQKCFIRVKNSDEKITNVRAEGSALTKGEKGMAQPSALEDGVKNFYGRPKSLYDPDPNPNFENRYQSLEIIKNNNPGSCLNISFDSEWVTCFPRYILSRQFAFYWEDKLYELIFLNTNNKLLLLEDVLGFILDLLNFKSYNYYRNSYAKMCVGYDSNGKPKWDYLHIDEFSYDLSKNIYPLFHTDNGYSPETYTIDVGHAKGYIDKFEPYVTRNYLGKIIKKREWLWYRKAFRLPKGDKRIPINLICHTGKVDLSTLDSYFEDNLLTFCSEVQGGLVTLRRPISMLCDSRTKEHAFNKYVYPVSITVRDTMCQAPAGKRKLKDLGKVVGLDKLFVGDDIEDMLGLLIKDPCKYFEYASRDSLVVLVYISRIYGFNDKIKVSITSASATFIENKIKSVLECVDDEDYNFRYRGLKMVDKGKVPNPVSPGFLDVSSLEPASLPISFVHQFATNAYHGGINMSSRIGFISEPTFDFDLKNAYPTAMCLVEDINWENPIRNEIIRRDLTLSDWSIGYGQYNPLMPMVAHVRFEFPENIKYPCIPVNVKGNLVFPRTSAGMDGVYCSGPELFLALKMGAKIFCNRGFFLNTNNTYSLRESTIDLVRDRDLAKVTDGKGSLTELLIKTMNNSGYGKIAQNVIDKRSWNAHLDQMESIGASKITNPVNACMITSIVRCLVISAMQELYTLGYKSYSCTTDGFISNCSLEVLDNLELGGFKKYVLYARYILTNTPLDDPKYPVPAIWEIKHKMPDGFLNLSTRANMALNLDGVSAHNSTKSLFEKDSYLDRLWFIIKGLSRDDRISYRENVWSTFKELAMGKDFKVVETIRRVTMDFDLKRKPVKASFVTVNPIIENKGYEIANFDTKPYEDVEEFLLYKSKTKSIKCLRTIDDWDIFWAKIIGAKTGKQIRIKEGLPWAKLMSCVMGFRAGLWKIDSLMVGTVQEKCDWINSLNLCDKEFKINDWKNCNRPERQANMLLREDLQDFLDIMKAYSFKV